jgi:hypothetical protein
MIRLTLRDWLTVLIGSAFGICWGILEPFSAIFFSPYLSALITGLIAKQNERTLSGITILIVHYGLLGIASYPQIRHYGWVNDLDSHKWFWSVMIILIIGIYPLGRAIGFLAVKLKDKKQTEQDIYLDLDKRLWAFDKKVDMKMKIFFAKLWTK